MSMRKQLPRQGEPREEFVPRKRGSMAKQLPKQDEGPEVRDYGYITPTAVTADLAAHVSATDPHPDLIEELPPLLSMNLTDELIVSQGGTHRRVSVQQLLAALTAVAITPNAGSLALTGVAPTVT